MAIGRGWLPAGQVAVWVLDLADPHWNVDAAGATLTAAERDRAARGTPLVERRRVLVRSALRQVLGGLLDLPPAEVPIELDDGRPVVGGSRRQRRLQASCSASGRAALVAVADRRRIGVDVQEIGQEDLPGAVAEGWLSAAERAAVQRLPAGEHARALTRAWTQKEAVLKARGVGLRADPGAVLTPLADSGRIGRWFLAPIEVGDGHVASLAVSAGPRPVVRPVVHRLAP